MTAANHSPDSRMGGSALPATRAECPPPGQCAHATCRMHLHGASARNQHGLRLRVFTPLEAQVIEAERRIAELRAALAAEEQRLADLRAKAPAPTCTLDLVAQYPYGMTVEAIAAAVGRTGRCVASALARARAALDGRDVETTSAREALNRNDPLAERCARLRHAIGENNSYVPRSAAEGQTT